LLASDAPPPESPYKCKKVETNSTQAHRHKSTTETIVSVKKSGHRFDHIKNVYH